MACEKHPNTILPHKTFASVQSVAQRYEISVNTVWRWVREGKFPRPVKLGARSTRWRLSDLEAWEVRS